MATPSATRLRTRLQHVSMPGGYVNRLAITAGAFFHHLAMVCLFIGMDANLVSVMRAITHIRSVGPFTLPLPKEASL